MVYSRRAARLFIGIVLGVSLLLLGPGLVIAVSASEPPDGSEPGDGAVVGLVSNAVGCLSVGDGVLAETSGVVRLTWEGQPRSARLVLDVAGSEAAHTIRVNGQFAALSPVYPAGEPCGGDESFYLDISPALLVQGENLIEITDDGLPGDGWTAANVRLEVLGDLVVPQPSAPFIPGQLRATAAPSTTIDFPFTSPYDGSEQWALVQVPQSYTDTVPTPLLVAVHARNGTRFKGLDWFDEEASDRGWLLASPELHGSWTPPPVPDKLGAYAYASLESQYDVIGTVQHVVDNYNVDPDRIYLAGYSMGGQASVIIAAKFPHLFAAVFDNKGPTDMDEWYDEQVNYYGSSSATAVSAMREECHIGGVPKTPTENPFCYQRRSGINFAGNYIHIPISMTHSTSDALVPVHHSRDMRDAINSHGPDRLSALFEDTTVTCAPDYHCYEPDPADVLDFLDPFRLHDNPTHVNITTDESKSFHWMNLVQAGGDHWSNVEVTYYPISATVAATISDSQPLVAAFNLGSVPVMGVIEQPGMGLPSTTYLVNGGGNNYLHNYTSGYLTTTLGTTGRFSLTISAVAAELSADPAMVLGSQAATCTITAVFQDHLNNPLPDGTMVQFSTSEGTFPNAGSTYAVAVTDGQHTIATTLDLAPGADTAVVVASVESVTASTSVVTIFPALDVEVSADPVVVDKGQAVTCTYQLTNTGDIALTGVTLADNYGILGEDINLAPGAFESRIRSVSLDQDTTITAIVNGQDPLGNEVIDQDSIRITVDAFDIHLPLVIRSAGI